MFTDDRTGLVAGHHITGYQAHHGIKCKTNTVTGKLDLRLVQIFRQKCALAKAEVLSTRLPEE